MRKEQKTKNKISKQEVGTYAPVSFSEAKKSWSNDQNFTAAYANLEPEYVIVRAVIEKRRQNNLSQKDLAKKLGTKQSAISRLESGTYNPTLSFLKKLSAALGGKLEIKI